MSIASPPTPPPQMDNNEIPFLSKTIIMTDTAADKKEVPLFWSEDPNVLLNPNYLFEVFPTSDMEYDQKLNAITRLVLLISIITFVYTRKPRIIYICLITVASIYVIRNYDRKNNDSQPNKEKFSVVLKENSPVAEVLGETNTEFNYVFDEPTTANPFSNVSVNMYGTELNKLPAPPAYNKSVNTEIVENVKEMVRQINKDNTDISDPKKDRLFRNLGENLLFEQSLRSYYSMPNTTIAGDQRAFAEYCYGNMISCKEGNNFACARNLVRHVGN
jgi:hypothetical protein